MIRLERKLFYERTQEMIDTAENWKNLKGKVREGAKKLGSKIAHPVKTSKAIGESVSGTYKKYRDDPGKLKTDAKNKIKKAGNFIKNNKVDAGIIIGGETVLPVAVGKVVGRLKGTKAGLAAGATVGLLPVGESIVAGKYFLKSKEGKTALKATGQRISGTARDIKTKLSGKKDKDTK